MSVKVHEAFCMDSFMDRLLFWDDFHGDQLQDEWREAGTGSAAVVDAQTGGIVRILTGATTNDAYQIDWNNIRSLLVTKKVTIEIRAKLTQITQHIVSLRLYFDGNNYIMFYNACLGAAANWTIWARDAGGFVNPDTGVLADTDYHIYRIEAFPTGEVHFYIDGVETNNSPITTNITALHLQPWLTISTREDVAKSMDIDYVYIRQER